MLNKSFSPVLARNRQLSFLKFIANAYDSRAAPLATSACVRRCAHRGVSLFERSWWAGAPSHLSANQHVKIERTWEVKRRFSVASNANQNIVGRLLKGTPHDFAKELKRNGLRRCFVLYDKHAKKVKISHPILKELADFLSEGQNYQEHEAIFFELGQRTEALLVAFLWRTTRGQAHGGIRMSSYSSMEALLDEGVRLSMSNGNKAALAGLWVGGGQGFIPELPERQHLKPEFREKLFYDYGDFLSGLNGCFIATEDFGINVYDINNVYCRTRYVTGISEDMGGLGNPCFAVGKGVVCAMEAAIDFLKLGNLKDKTIAVQGGGNVGAVVISELLDKGAGFVFATDCLQKHVEDLTDLMAEKANGRFKIVKVPFDDQSVLSYKCDILAPCALGNILNEKTIPTIQAKIVCGAANNQLSSAKENQLLIDNGIIYVVDSLANRMGMVIQDAEGRGRQTSDPVISRHFSKDWENSIFTITKRILQNAKDENITPAAAASSLAKRLIDEPHPLWPNRGEQIVSNLVANKWHEGLDFWRRRSNFSGARNVW